jgi:predicted choloylglycine hydrolase
MPTLRWPPAVCEGSPYEMGLQQGAFYRKEIFAAVDKCTRLEQFRVDAPAWMPRKLFLLIGKCKATRAMKRPLLQNFPDLSARLRGIADGSKAGRGTIYLANAIEAMLSSVTKRITLPPAGCSAVAVRGTRSAFGEPVIARNFDYLTVVQPYMVLRRMKPKGLFSSLEFTVAPLVGCIDGMNERGLCITYNYAYATDQGRAGATIGMLISSALARCSTVSEAAAFISGHKRWGGAILMLADASGDIASLELTGTQASLRRPEAGSDMVFHTNRFCSPEMRKVEVQDQAVFTKPADVRGLRVHESGDRRHARLETLLVGKEPLTGDQLLTIMGDHGVDQKPCDTTVCIHGPLRSTVATMQHFPQSRRMRFSLSSACKPKFIDVEV